MICENLSICVAVRTEHFWVWALGPQTGSMSTSRLLYGSLLRANPRHLSAYYRCVEGGDMHYSHGRDAQDTK